jgi:hypothetical protein
VGPVLSGSQKESPAGPNSFAQKIPIRMSNLVFLNKKNGKMEGGQIYASLHLGNWGRDPPDIERKQGEIHSAGYCAAGAGMERDLWCRKMQSKSLSSWGSTTGAWVEGLKARGRLLSREMCVSEREEEIAGMSFGNRLRVGVDGETVRRCRAMVRKSERRKGQGVAGGVDRWEEGEAGGEGDVDVRTGPRGESGGVN